ncbi:MRN complex-interacting protein [Cephus cinctus]|uniref:MRN complex-interacting protein n=1 Tax=Cephus cinctus TaxID=211228 RepID=A0AAJ7BK81_CEPCN|nr:MRN complex-interacting protein [Cephus cinctus]XP_024937114.1 MRN complex-interacting protein [Cephus cinctus]
MSSAMNVLCCYSCQMFQVHPVKKANKWQCKVCGEKQSIKQVYYRGTGKDCRVYVQESNLLKSNATQWENDIQSHDLEVSEDDCAVAPSKSLETHNQMQSSVVPESKWSKYLNKAEREDSVN